MALPQVYFIGYNRFGQCIFPTAGNIAVPAAAPRDWLSDGKLVLTVTAGYEFTLLLADDNQLFAVGSNESSQLGRGHSNDNDPDNRRQYNERIVSPAPRHNSWISRILR